MHQESVNRQTYSEYTFCNKKSIHTKLRHCVVVEMINHPGPTYHSLRHHIGGKGRMPQQKNRMHNTQRLRSCAN